MEEPPTTPPAEPSFFQPDRRQGRVASGRAMRAIKVHYTANRTFMELVADLLTRIASSTPFFVLHVVWFFTWIIWNTRVFGTRAFDPFPFGLLTMIVSLEAIFLSIFVLMTQSRESGIAELREEVNLQVNLRIEQEVTKTLQLVAGLYTRLGHRMGEDADLREMLLPLDAEQIERELLEQIRNAARQRKRE